MLLTKNGIVAGSHVQVAFQATRLDAEKDSPSSSSSLGHRTAINQQTNQEKKVLYSHGEHNMQSMNKREKTVKKAKHNVAACKKKNGWKQ